MGPDQIPQALENPAENKREMGEFHGSTLLTMTLSKVERVIAFPRQDTRLKESNYEAEAA